MQSRWRGSPCVPDAGTLHVVARAIAWLPDPENDWITGQSVAVDGVLSSIVPRLRS